MSNKVSDVARYMIKCAEESGRPISNLKLQKVLYFLWKGYYRENNEYLFDDDSFFAWKFGPVVPSVYYEYFMFGAYPISNGLLEPFNEGSLCPKVQQFIESAMKDYQDKSVAELIKQTHAKGGAWDRIFRDRKGIKEIIPYEEIIKDISNETVAI